MKYLEKVDKSKLQKIKEASKIVVEGKLLDIFDEKISAFITIYYL